MVRLSQIQDFMAQQAARDRATRAIRIEAASLEEALDSGAVRLGLPLGMLEYEIVTRGDHGVFGVGRKPWVVQVYQSTLAGAPVPAKGESGAEAGTGAAPADISAHPGEISIKLVQGSVLLKVTKPRGKAPRVTEQMAGEALAGRGITDLDAGMVGRVVRRADGEFVQVGTFDYNPANDALASVQIAEQEMKAYVEVKPPGIGGADLTFEALLAALGNNGVQHGINEAELRELEDTPRYNTTILAAQGTPAEDGADARIEYSFNTDRAPILKEKNGRVDFRELNLVENVVAGQIVAKKDPGRPGARRPHRHRQDTAGKGGARYDSQRGKERAARRGRDDRDRGDQRAGPPGAGQGQRRARLHRQR